jgi:uncharacterized membrane protein YdjX (TVP38/TMEM64 family)
VLGSLLRRPRRPRPAQAGHALRFAALVALVAGLGVLTLLAGPDRDALLAAVSQSRVFAPAAAVLGSALLVAALVPRTLLALVGGALFGTVSGAFYVLVGVTAGAVLAFGIGRLLGRGFVSARLRGRLALVEAAVSRRGVWAVVICRLIPIVPFAISNYAFGTTAVRLRQLVAGTLLGALPATVAYAALGSATMHGDWVGARVAGASVLVLGVSGSIGTYLVWRRRPRGTAAAGVTASAAPAGVIASAGPAGVTASAGTASAGPAGGTPAGGAPEPPGSPA